MKISLEYNILSNYENLQYFSHIYTNLFNFTYIYNIYVQLKLMNLPLFINHLYYYQ